MVAKNAICWHGNMFAKFWENYLYSYIFSDGEVKIVINTIFQNYVNTIVISLQSPKVSIMIIVKKNKVSMTINQIFSIKQIINF